MNIHVDFHEYQTPYADDNLLSYFRTPTASCLTFSLMSWTTVCSARSCSSDIMIWLSLVLQTTVSLSLRNDVFA